MRELNCRYMLHCSKFRKRDNWRNFSVAQLFEPLEIVLESSVIIYRSRLHFQRTGDIQFSYKVVVFFPFLTYTQMMFSAPYESLLNVLHQSAPFTD